MNMKILKTALSLVLVIITLLSAVPFAVNAESKEGTIYPFIPQVHTYYADAENYIAERLRARDITIDVSMFGIPKGDLIYIYRAVMFDNPDIFYVDSAYIPYKYDKENGIIAIIVPQYIFKRSKIPSYVKKFNSACDNMISGIKSSWTDFQKALVIHDRIVAHCAYKSQNLKSYTAYNVIVKGKGICEGYARAYCYLLSLVGVDSKCINNESKSHCWNVVKIDGNWYQVDVTSDDPYPDTSGYVRHKFFLLTDTGLLNCKSGTHSGFKKDITYSSAYKCSSSKYNGSFFRNITSQIVYKNKAYYYFNNNYKKKRYSALMRRKSGSKKAVKVIKDKWRYSNGVRINVSYCKLCEVGDYIFFNSKRKIFRLNTNTGKIKRMMTLPSFKKMNYIGVESKGKSVYALKKNANLTAKAFGKIIKVSSSGKATVIPFLKYKSLKLEKKSSYKLKVYYGSGKIAYKSSNKRIAKVSSKGAIKAKKKGNCTITATRNGKKLKCKIKVY